MAREMHGSAVSVPGLKDYADVIERLACDARMRWVWRELQKKHRPGQKRGKYFYPASPAAVHSHPLLLKDKNVPAVREATRNLTQEDKLQNEAFAILFNEVANLRSWPAGDFGPRTKTTKEATREIAALRAVAQRIRADAETLRQLRLGNLSPSLEDVAKVCIAFADIHAAHNDHDVLIVSRNRSHLGGPWERGFVITVAHILEHFFGQKMQGLVAALANVAFDRNDITESQVNGVFRRKGVS
jgi:hypothetical protein